jgi:hypothetical protein
VSRRQTVKARQPQRKRSAQPSITQTNAEQSVQQPPRRWPWIAGVLAILLLLGLAFWHGLVSNAPPPASAFSNSADSANVSSGSSTWKTIQTFTGQATNGVDVKTKQFTVTSNWQISWSCKGIDGNDEQMNVVIYNPDGSLYNAGADITCLATQQVNGHVQEIKAGTYYLDIASSTAWTVQVQVSS